MEETHETPAIETSTAKEKSSEESQGYESVNEKQEDKIVCNFCKKECASKNSLKRHLITHTGEKPYQCNM